jgi:hypothetical protein
VERIASQVLSWFTFFGTSYLYQPEVFLELTSESFMVYFIPSHPIIK